MELTDVQWTLLQPLVRPKTPKKRRGRPWRDTREVLEGVLWILRTGAQWAELPRDKFPPYQTCHRRFQQWVREGTLVKLLRRLAEDLLARGQLDLAETFIDASFSGAKRGAVLLVQHAAAKGARSWQSRTAMVFLSPWGLQALRRMRLSSSRPPSSSDSPGPRRSA
jgi:transposase